jgi:polyphosphate kinase 2 (PPK2 family)
MLANAGIIILKYYLDICKEKQVKRLEDRKDDPLNNGKSVPLIQWRSSTGMITHKRAMKCYSEQILTSHPGLS